MLQQRLSGRRRQICSKPVYTSPQARIFPGHIASEQDEQRWKNSVDVVCLLIDPVLARRNRKIRIVAVRGRHRGPVVHRGAQARMT